MLKTRVISGVFLVAILGSALYIGDYYLWGLLLVISLIGMYEFFRAVHGIKLQEKYSMNIMEKTAAVCTVFYYILLVMTGSSEVIYLELILSLALLMCIYVAKFPRFQAVEAMQTYFGMIYVAVMLSFIYRIRAEFGFTATVLVICASWVCDTCAYFSGITLGKHKLFPKLSPKKSVEGAIGGVIGSGIVGFILGALVQGGIGILATRFMIISAAGAVISQFGDLFASAIKRNHDIKDYGNLIPGHGGILDRFDSVIITAPLIYSIALLLLKGIQ